MIPVLYAPDATLFASRGLGGLADAISCTVTEERNGLYELDMTYPYDGIHFKEIAHSCLIMAKPNETSDPQPFRIYSITKPINGIVKIKAEHISYQMSHIPVSAFTETTCPGALAGLASHATVSCPFTFWTDKETVADFKVTEPVSMRSRLGGTEGSILDVYGGEWEFDRWTAKLHNTRGADNGVTLRYGKNITDLTQEENIANTITGITPFWKGTDANGAEVVVTLPEHNVMSTTAANYPYNRVVPMDFSQNFDNQPTVEQLRTAAQSYISASDIGIPSVSIKVSFVALWQTEEYKSVANLERVSLCDTVTVHFERLGIDVKSKVIKTVWDVLKGRYNSIEIGDTKTNLNRVINEVSGMIRKTMADTYVKKTGLQSAIDHASRTIIEGLGGTVVLKTDANGKYEEILILSDSSDYLTAQQVWRWNRNGLGYSSTGYNGTYRTAITADGHVVADFIDTGTLNAALINVINLTASAIHGGVLTLGGQDNANGRLRILDSSGAQIGKWDNSGFEGTGIFTMKYIASNVERQFNFNSYSVYVPVPSWYDSAGDGSLDDVEPTWSTLTITGLRLIQVGDYNKLYFGTGKYMVEAPSLEEEIPDYKEVNLNYIISKGTLYIKADTQEVTQSKYYIRLRGDSVTLKGTRSRVHMNYNELELLHNASIKLRGSVQCTSNVTVARNFTANGTKSRVVSTKDYADRLLYCYETSSPLFGDVGEGKISEDGFCYVVIDAILKETITTDQYQVFLQKYGSGDCWVKERKAGYFVVEGTPDLEFGWELKAKQSDFDQLRLEKHTEQVNIENSMDYGEDAVAHIDQIRKARET